MQRFKYPTLPLPSFPAELWGMVFRLAVEPDGLIDTTPLPPLQSGPRSWDESRSVRLVRVRANGLRRFPLVCKLWKTLATPILYESISIRRSDHFHAIVHMLEADPELFKALKRVVIGYSRYEEEFPISHIWGQRKARTDELEDQLSELPLQKLLSKCVNLRVLIVFTSVRTKHLIARLAHIVPPSSPLLRHLSLLSHEEVEYKTSFEHITAWSPCFEMLEVLSISIGEMSGENHATFRALFPCLAFTPWKVTAIRSSRSVGQSLN
jgi:hypothetical protein